ncbi:DUF3592 domain-containing protein [Microbacterium sp. NPDC058342]|uniref:DUF3592 domain-containing protein n=1 Tax=Microbacterium sp. NPDC058342 TaxID=3346454 RepID=UPI0036516BE1
MAEHHRLVAWIPMTGAVLVFGSAAFIGFWLSRTLVVGVSIDTGDLPVLSLAALVGLGGATLMMKVRRVETDRSLLPSFALMALGGALGVGVSAAVLGTPLVAVFVLLPLAAALGAVSWWRARRIRHILTRGHQVDAEFVEVRGGHSDATSAYEGVSYLIRYSDEAGAPRELRGSTSVPSGNIPRPGDPLTLWYDPHNPRRHVVRVTSEQD